jgi:hypothetical protein
VEYLSRFKPDATRSAEFLACLWQGEVPESFTLQRWLYIGSPPRGMFISWEGDDAALAWVDRSFGGFGELQHEVVTDATPGLAACVERDLDAFGAWLASRSTAPEQIEAQLDIRRRGLEAATQEEAAAAGRTWAGEQAAR